MSAVRRKFTRSNRTVLSSPYARPVKKLSWSFSGLLNYLNPLRRLSSTEDAEANLSDEDFDVEAETMKGLRTSAPIRTPSKRGQQAEDVLVNGRGFSNLTKKPAQAQVPPPASRPTSIPSVDFTFQASSSASKNLDTVTNFLTSHANKPIAPEDINQMVALIQQSKPEPFRFETRAATTPPRSKSPSAPPRGSSAPRTLSRNPNGSYRWKGAGSARAHRTRNSYSSPAFRTPRYTVPSSSASSLEISSNDAKRRRVGDSTAETQVPLTQDQVSFPTTSSIPSRTTSTGHSLKPPPVATPVRQRTPGLAKPTAPVVPSPLRQAWTGGSPSGSESGSPQGSSTFKQTETAKHVSELVNSLKSQDKVLDELRNPYEAANPVKRSSASKRKRVTAPAKKPTANIPKEDNTNVKTKGISVHAIIEATLPEGSKRSRPPADLAKPGAGTKQSPKVAVEEEEIEDSRVAKRAKSQANGHTTREAVDVEMQSSQLVAAKDNKEKPPPLKAPAIPAPSPQPSTSAKSLFGPKSSMPKEPSKLRFSMQPESTSTPPSPVPEPRANLQGAPKPVLSGFTFAPSTTPSTVTEAENRETTPTNFFTPPVLAPTLEITPSPPAPVPTTTITPKSAKDAAKLQLSTSLPTFTFTFPVPSTTSDSKARDEAKAILKASLPTFDLTKYPSSSTSPSQKGFEGNAANIRPPTTLTAGDWTADEMKVHTPADGGGWTCEARGLKNPAAAAAECTTCETARP